MPSSYFFARTYLLHWLPVTSKKICKWLLCLVVMQNYYGNLRVMSVTWNIRVFITFSIADSMVRHSGSRTNYFLLNLFPYILKSWAKEAYRLRISHNLELYLEKTPPQMFLAFLAENGSVKCNQVPLSSQTPQTYFESSTRV